MMNSCFGMALLNIAYTLWLCHSVASYGQTIVFISMLRSSYEFCCANTVDDISILIGLDFRFICQAQNDILS